MPCGNVPLVNTSFESVPAVIGPTGATGTPVGHVGVAATCAGTPVCPANGLVGNTSLESVPAVAVADWPYAPAANFAGSKL